MNIKSTDTVDVWADVSSRLLYRVRVHGDANPAQNFVDTGLDYKGGTVYPFLVSGQSKDGSAVDKFVMKTTLDSTANTLKSDFNITLNGSSAVKVGGSFSLQPSSSTLTVAVPPGAKPITDVLNSLGLSGLFAPTPAQAASAGNSAGSVLTQLL